METPTRPMQLPPWESPVPILAMPLETERLVIRCYTLDDVDALFEAIDANRDALLPWMSWASAGHRSRVHTAKFVTEQILACEDHATFQAVSLGIFERASGSLVGSTGIHCLHRGSSSCETGYWIRPEVRGRGYAGEACARTISWAMGDQPGGLGLRRVRAFSSADNMASRRVLEKLGLPLESVQREDYYVEGYGLTDRLGWGVLRCEWDCHSHRFRAPASGRIEPRPGDGPTR